MNTWRLSDLKLLAQDGKQAFGNICAIIADNITPRENGVLLQELNTTHQLGMPDASALELKCQLSSDMKR